MKIIIIGGRGTANVVADQIYDAQERFGMKTEFLGFALDDLSKGDSINGYPILSPIRKLMENYGKYEDVKFLYCLYNPDDIPKWTSLLLSLDIPIDKFTNFIHPSVMMSRSTKIGNGNIILANAVVNCNFVMGNFNTINSSCLLGHDSEIGNNNYFAGQVCLGSGVSIGNMNFIGLNSSIRNRITMGDANIVAMSSNVVKSIDSSSILIGNPAKIKDGLNNIIR